MVVFVGLPKHHVYLVIGKITDAEQFHVFVCKPRSPTFTVTGFDPITVMVGNAVALVAKGFRFLFILFAGM